MRVLVINCGSSSIKFQLYAMTDERILAKGKVERIGEPTARFDQKTERGEKAYDAEAPDHDHAMKIIHDELLDKDTGVLASETDVEAVGHRVVHGGEAFIQSGLINDDVIATIKEFFSLAPLHNPPNLAGIQAAQHFFPEVPHVAVFDTAFHQTMPKHAYLYALPYDCYEKHRVRRYGFHGTSHRFVTLRGAEMLGKPVEQFTAITCHLGNGCSMAAVKNGKSIDTTMGLTPLEGLVMGTRSGDIDPALPFFLQRKLGMTCDEADRMLNKQSGLLGVSGISNDIREIWEQEKSNERARLALDIFAYRVKKYIGAYIAALGETDAVIFTGGIGERDPEMRERICTGLDHIGIIFDPKANADCFAKEGIFTTPESKVKAMVVPTNEELLIARDTRDIAEKSNGRPKG